VTKNGISYMVTNGLLLFNPSESLRKIDAES